MRSWPLKARKKKDNDNDNDDASGGMSSRGNRSRKRNSAPETVVQETMFEKVQAHAAEVSAPASEGHDGPEQAEKDEQAPANEPISEEGQESVAEAETPLAPNEGTLLVDATCAPADIAYPTDLDLLNEAREKLEAIIDALHEPVVGQVAKPRTYREKARKQYLAVSKQRRPGSKVIRKAIKRQLG